MCGLAGFLTPHARPDRPFEAVLARMTRPIRHRGPDDAGAWADAEAGIALGHRRLSIVDLSPEGHQPMPSASGRFVMVFNGEVYNFEAVRRALPETYPFRGHSDTEVMLAAFEAWGVEASLERFVGMFAFALWDRQSRTLTLARDRLGIKPLYYGVQDGVLAFASELDALCEAFERRPPLNRAVLPFYLRRNFVPAPHSIYQGVFKLDAGHTLRARLDGGRVEVEKAAFWSLADVASAGQADPFTGSDDAATDALEAVLDDAVRLRMIADVPLGAFLSGGVDSSLVVALMRRAASAPVQTFSIGFDNAGYDEAPHARAVAGHLGTDHTELYAREADVLDTVPKLARFYDEPFADASQIPTYLVSALARQHVTVSLSGDGGDELFGGYSVYGTAERLWRLADRLPLPVRALVARLIASRAASGLLARAGGEAGPRRVQKLARVFEAPTFEIAYSRLQDQLPDAGRYLVGGSPPAPPPRAHAFPDLRHRMMLEDALTYLPDDILTKVDRASMAVSLEARVPLLDHRVAAFAWRLPMSMKVRDGRTKWLLRRVLYRHVPPALIDRPKQGFGIPIGAFLRGPLRAWADDLLDPERLEAESVLAPGPVQVLWAAHRSGQADHAVALWNVLMLQQWIGARYPHGEPVA